MKKRNPPRKASRAILNPGGKRFTPLTAKEIGRLGGRRNFLQFEDADYPLIQRMAMYMPEKHIAGVYGIDDETFRRMKLRDPRLKRSLERGSADGVALVGRSLAQMAMSKRYPGCTIFYMKTKGGLRETVNVETTNKISHDPEVEETLRAASSEEVRQIVELLREGGRKSRSANSGKDSRGKESLRIH